jgi:hypothetical protein
VLNPNPERDFSGVEALPFKPVEQVSGIGRLPTRDGDLTLAMAFGLGLSGLVAKAD